MPVFKRLLRYGSTAITATAVIASAALAERFESAQDPPAPPASSNRNLDFFSAPPFDRITLSDGTLCYVDPISPRPLPPPPERKPKSKKPAKPEIPYQGNIPLPGEKLPDQPKPETDDDPEDATLTIHLQEGEVRDFKVKRSNIKSVDYYEDMLLGEADRLSAERRFATAFELILKVRERSPTWKGITDHADKLLFNEGSVALLESDGDRGLRLLRELALRRPDYPDLADKLANAYSVRAAKALDLGLYTLGRSILHTSEAVTPNHQLLKGVRERFIAKAEELFDKAKASEGPDKLDSLVKALEIWPKLGGADAAYREAFAAIPTLTVAVNDVPRQVGPWFRTPADRRVTPLFYLPVVADDSEDALEGKGNLEQLASKVAVSELGRRLTIDIRPNLKWSDGSRPVSSIDLVRSFTELCDPAFPGYSARWSDLLDKVDVNQEGQIEIGFSRPSLRAGSWLTGPIGPAHAGVDGKIAAKDGTRILVGDGRYHLTKQAGDLFEFQGPPDAKIRRIQERRFADQKSLMGAFERGEVTLVAHLPPDQIAGLSSSDEIKIGRYPQPILHMLALDARNPAFRNRALRRGLNYAVDRKLLLEDVILKRPADEANFVSDGPFPKGNYADAPDVKPFGYDPLLGRMLVVAAKKELGNQPLKFNFDYPAIPEAQAVAPKIAEAFRLLGLEIVLRERPESELEESLHSGARFDIAYRATVCREPTTDVGLLISPGYDAPSSFDTLTSIASPRILQLLLQLERAPEFPSAKAIAIQIDRECRDELPMLPLWQLEDHYAWRSRLKGPLDVSDSLYQTLDTWEIEPWFRNDPW